MNDRERHLAEIGDCLNRCKEKLFSDRDAKDALDELRHAVRHLLSMEREREPTTRTAPESPCTCAEIQRKDPLRHFRECPLREDLPPGHPQADENWKSAFLSFCISNGLTLEVHERSDDSELPHYWIRFWPHTEIMRNGMLESASGDGSTRLEAARNLAQRICGKRLAINAYLQRRRETQAPEKWQADDLDPLMKRGL